jgi:uncharacterized membrane protein YqjE
MPASRAGLFESLRQLLNTALELAQVRLELLVADLQLEKLRLVEVALRALLGLLLLGLGLLLLQAAKRRLRDGDELLAATRAEFERDRAALRPRD